MLARMFLFALLPICSPKGIFIDKESQLFGLWYCEKVTHHLGDSIYDISPRYAGYTIAYFKDGSFTENCPSSNLEFSGKFKYHAEKSKIIYSNVMLKVVYPEAKVPMDPLVMESGKSEPHVLELKNHQLVLVDYASPSSEGPGDFYYYYIRRR
jgi:hypothetical protein